MAKTDLQQMPFGFGGPPSSVRASGPPKPKKTKEQEFFDMVYQEAYAQGDFKPALVAAQAVLETGYGKSEKAKKKKNFFGMKLRNNEKYWQAANEGSDEEWASFNSLSENIRQRRRKLKSSPVYGNVRKATTVEEYAKALAPWAPEDKEYANKLLRIVSQYASDKQEEGLKYPQGGNTLWPGTDSFEYKTMGKVFPTTYPREVIAADHVGGHIANAMTGSMLETVGDPWMGRKIKYVAGKIKEDVQARNAAPFIDRVKSPESFPTKKNEDGSVSTHLMAAEVDEDNRRVWYAFPTLIPPNRPEEGNATDQWLQFEDNREALAHNKEYGNIKKFYSKKRALAYAKGGYKTKKLKKLGEL
jgi:hypothetical protein